MFWCSSEWLTQNVCFIAACANLLNFLMSFTDEKISSLWFIYIAYRQANIVENSSPILNSPFQAEFNKRCIWKEAVDKLLQPFFLFIGLKKKKVFLKFLGGTTEVQKSCVPSNALGGTRQDSFRCHIHFEQEAAEAAAPSREKREEV